jgi:predicted MFS family arabinose efflux permease
MLAIIMVFFGFFMALVCLSPSIILAEIAMIPVGASSIALIATANSLLQLNSSQEMRGRVMSLYVIAFLGTTPIGAPLVGVVVAWTNPRIGIAMGAVAALIAGAGLFVQLRQEDHNMKALQEV